MLSLLVAKLTLSITGLGLLGTAVAEGGGGADGDGMNPERVSTPWLGACAWGQASGISEHLISSEVWGRSRRSMYCLPACACAEVTSKVIKANTPTTARIIAV